MFACPGYSGCQYEHGDDRYASDDESCASSGDFWLESRVLALSAMIVGRRLRRQTAGESASISESGGESSGSSGISAGTSVSSASDGAPSTRAEGSLSSSAPTISRLATFLTRRQPELGESSSNGLLGDALATSVAQTSADELDRLELRPTETKGDRRHRNTTKKRARSRARGDTSPTGDALDGASSRFSGAQILHTLHRGFGRASSDTNSGGEEAAGDTLAEEIVVCEPPGREKHCPESTLASLFPNERPQREIIDDMIRYAYRLNIIAKKRRTASRHRMPSESTPTTSGAMPKSSIGQPNADGPFCVMRGENEHVNFYGAAEIDKAHKGREHDPALKIIIVTRCVDESNEYDAQLANEFIRVTRQKQQEKDAIKREKVGATGDRSFNANCPIFSSTSRSSASRPRALRATKRVLRQRRRHLRPRREQAAKARRSQAATRTAA